MKIINVNTKTPYNIIIYNNILGNVGDLVKGITQAKKVCVISDSNVSDIYSPKVIFSLNRAGFCTCLFSFKAGEKSKNLNTINDIYSFLCKNHITKTDLVISLGGGVTGDMVGFASATYLRGINYIQIPTSLLAQIDSSVGGKTGVNIEYGKNLVGAFHQPKLVIIDPSTLSTLSDYYFHDGLAEAIKYGCIKSPSLFKRLEEENPRNFIEDLIYECLSIKKEIVENDEFESSERVLLNFGHTIGHSIERIYDYEKFSHGQAIAIGMAMITKASEKYNISKSGTYKRLISVLKKYNLPICDGCSLSDIVKHTSTDKKSIGSNINIILIRDFGDSFIQCISKGSLLKFLKTVDDI